MMLTKTDGRPTIPRDGKHCDLCGCSQPAVRCDKCGRQAFCLSCDDMYHRHPKRRFHLRKAVDAAPPQRPALPAKGGTLGGDPSKMPLPPPRKKKFFDTFRKRSPSAEGSPPLPKKEWTFGSIKNKFMSNRPLPPLPDNNGPEETTTTTNKHDLTFIHKKVDEKPPQLPQRSLKPNEFNRSLHENGNQPTNGVRDVRNGTLNPSHMSRNNGYGEENQWSDRPTEHPNPNTLMRQQGYIYPGNPGYPGPMSSSTTDLHTMEMHQQHPQYPYPPMAYPHYPPVYPQGYPGGYFGSSFANLSTTENDQSDHSDVSRQGGKKGQFRKRAKRSQSVLMDRMAYPGGQFFPPFGPFPPGFGPWGPYPPSADHPPRSPSGSVRSLSRARTRRRTKKTTSEDEDEDEEFSNVSSSPLSRPSSSSGRQQKAKVPSSSVKKFDPSSSSSEEDFEDAQRSRSERVPRRDSDPKKLSSPVPRSPQMQQKKFFYKQKKSETLRSSDAEDALQKVARQTSSSKDINTVRSAESPTSPAPFTPPNKWECAHCTFINSAGNRICQVCCKTATAEIPPEDGRNSSGTSPADGRISAMSADGRISAGPSPADSRSKTDGRNSAGQQVADGRISAGQLPVDGRTSSEMSCSSPEKRMEEDEDVDTRRTKQDMAVLNSALDEAEKEISRGLEELMKLKEDFPPSRPTPPPQNKPEARPPQTPPPPGQNKPVYKSSGKLRNASILDKITMPQTKTTSTSTGTETQTSTDHVIEARRGQTSNSDHVIEARRGSTSSTTSDAYNSPMAQSPILQRTSPLQGAVKKGPKKDTSIQTDDLMDYRTRVEEEAYFGKPSNGYGYRYGDGVTSPVPSMYHHPVMQRSHSRASLFTGRVTDMGPLDYGLGPSPMYRSVSRSSLTGDYAENSFADFHNLRKPAYYLSMEELVERRRQDSIRAQGLELVRMIREAEQQGFTADDIQVALHNCPPGQPPVEWLQENWRQLAAQVVAMAANYANEKRENDVGVVSDVEAREALRMHKGNVWPAVTECVESRQRKFLELKARGKFSTKDITDALSANQGDVELAYAKLSKSSSKPFLMRIWGAGEGVQNQDIPPKAAPTNAKDLPDFYYKDRDDIQSTGTWDEDDVEWDEDSDEEEEEEEEQGDLEDLQTCHEDLTIKTPDSDRSDYCDAFGSNTLERNTKLPTAEPEVKLARRGSFLSRLGGLKRNDSRRSSQIDLSSLDSSKNYTSQENLVPSPDQSKSYNPISVIKNTISAIRDTVGGSKTEKKLPCAAPERRTIVVKGQIPQDSSSVASGVDNGVTLTSVKPLKDSEATLRETSTVAHEFGDKKINKKESNDLPIKTPLNVDVNQQLTASTSDLKNKIGELVSLKKVARSSVKIEETDLNSLHEKVSSKNQDITATKEANISHDNKSEVIDNDDRSTYNSKEKSSQPSKTSKFSFKNNLENNIKDLKSEQKIQEFLQDTKENATKENKTSFLPETSSSSNKEFVSKTNKVEQKVKTKYNSEKESLVNKLHSDDVSSTSPIFSDKIPEKENQIQSENEARTGIPYSNDKNVTSVARSEKSPKSDLSKTHTAKLSEIFSDIKANGSKDVLQDIRTEHDDSLLTNNSTTINPSSSITEKIMTNCNIQNQTETLSLGNEESQIKEDFSNNVKENASECTTDKLFDETGHGGGVSTSSEGVEIPLIDDVDTSLADTPSQKNSMESESPTFKSMDPIHSSTFKRSLSNQSSDGKIESRTSSETLSMETIESQTPSTNITDNADTMIETKQAVTSREAFVNAKTPVQMAETGSGPVIDSAKEDLKVVENKITKEMKEAAANMITSKLKKSSRLKEADKSQMVSSSSSTDTAEITEDNSYSDFVNQTNLGQNEKSHSESSIQKENSSMSSLQTLDTIASPQSSFSKAETSNDSMTLEYSNSELSQETKALDTSSSVHSSSVTATSLPATSISTDSASVLSAASTTITSVPYGTGITPLTSDSEASTTTNYITPTSVSNVSTIVSDAATSSIISSVDVSVTTASISTTSLSPGALSTVISSASSSSANTVISVSDAPFTSLSTASTTITSTDNVSASSITPASNASVPTASLFTTSLSDASISAPDASLPTSAIFTDSTTVTTPTDASISTASSSITPTTNVSSPTNSTSTSTPITDDSFTTSSTSVSTAPNASIPTDSTTTLTPITGDISASTAAPSPITSTPNAPIPTDSSPSISNSTFTPVLTTQISTDNDATDDDTSDPISPIEALRHRFEGLAEDGGSVVGPIRPASPFRRMSFRSIKGAIALERNRDSSLEKPWFLPKPKAIETKKPVPRRNSLKQQMETERKVRQMVADRKVRTYRKAEIVVQLMDMNFDEEEAVLAATECSNFEMALSYLQQECLLCTGHFPVSHIISMVHCAHKACRDCIRAYFTVQIRDRNIMELLCPFCNEPDIADDDIAHDYFNHLDMMLKKLVDPEIHELFQRKLRDRVLMRDPSFRWCSKCSSGFLAMDNVKLLVCPDCNAVTCSSCRRPWEKEHQGISCEAFARLKDGNDNEAQAVSLAKLLTEDGIDCPRCHFRYALAKGGCMHFRCIQCQHDFCSGCYRPFKMGKKCGVSEFCSKLGLHAHHPRNCLFYLRDKDPEDLQRLLDMSGIKFDRDPPASAAGTEEGEVKKKSVCQVMEQKETGDGMVDDCCGKEVEGGFAGLCRLHYVEYLGQLVNKHQVDPIQIFENDDLELVLRRANIRLPPKRYRESDESYREKLVNLIHEELPLDKMDGS